MWVIELFWKFMNSIVATSMIGAFAGAYGGQWIVEKSKDKENAIKELRNINAAIVIAFSICESYIGLKHQIIGPLKKNFEEQKKYYTERKKGTATIFL
jgi:hypothetical protein